MKTLNSIITRIEAGTTLNQEEKEYLLEILNEHKQIAEEWGVDVFNS